MSDCDTDKSISPILTRLGAENADVGDFSGLLRFKGPKSSLDAVKNCLSTSPDFTYLTEERAGADLIHMAREVALTGNRVVVEIPVPDLSDEDKKDPADLTAAVEIRRVRLAELRELIHKEPDLPIVGVLCETSETFAIYASVVNINLNDQEGVIIGCVSRNKFGRIGDLFHLRTS